ncbi:hypothetical protein PFICI_09480 [Pestalotiopsis fici W106-1]|uniref:AB hydrolase-1 domain-containing protein n=1 Tax=Pestalotiopsis fici (strain W106-1 / CGMCC3.15140) TaxID=1229662 RepID=W3X2K3_PESFW|nr:uncharacterized protein PFICI_09480 [Pestalotiopsis fici W106-1]ETS79627.1 hypothetical protein PFICI_09480 [Pestalotiopsis fici W106-1]
MLVNQTPVNYALVVATKYGAGYVGLACFLYFLSALFIGGVRAISLPFSILVESYGAIEILWYLLWFLPFKARVQKPGRPMVMTTRPQRKALFEVSLDQVSDARLFIRKWLGNAHLDEIYRDDIKDWLLSYLWATDTDVGVDADELEEYIELIEQKANLTLLRGRAGAKPIRLHLDPVQVSHRSIFFYIVIGVVDIITVARLMMKGFNFYAQPRSSFFRVFPLRLMTLFAARRSASPHFSYFYRPHTSKTHRPMVFFHGVGLGLSPYVAWLDTIPKDIGILALEMLPVSMRICPEAVAPADFQKAMTEILSQQGIDDFVLVGDSYGTLLARPLLDDPALAAKVDSLVLCDPVALLAHLPDAVYNLTRRTPQTAPELQARALAALDPGVAHTLARRMHWPEHTLLRENLVGRRTTAVVAGRDCIINANAVAGYVYYSDAGYITSADAEELRKTPELWTGRAELELIYLHDRGHGQCMRAPAEMRRVTNVVEMYARLDLDTNEELGEKTEAGQEQDTAEVGTVASRSSQVSAANFV